MEVMVLCGKVMRVGHLLKVTFGSISSTFLSTVPDALDEWTWRRRFTRYSKLLIRLHSW